MTTLAIDAPGKLNLCLYLGPTRADGFHELASLFESVSLHDSLTLRQLESGEDRVICEAVPGENLAGRALRGAREAGLLTGPPVEITIEKRVPIAAGMGGGSADAAAALRLVGELEGHAPERFERIAFALGADVPSQLVPGASLVRGAGEKVVPIDPRCLADAERAYVIIEQPTGLSTADVFNQADRSELPEAELAGREETLLETVAGGLDTAGIARLIVNGLQPAIVALRPELAGLPDELLAAGALAAAFTGSGPTSFGLFADEAAAEAAAAALRERGHLAHAAVPVGADFAQPRRISEATS